MSRLASVSVVLWALLPAADAIAQGAPLVLPGAMPPAAQTPPRAPRPDPARPPRTGEAAPSGAGTGATAGSAAATGPLPAAVAGQKHFLAGNPAPDNGELIIVEHAPGFAGLRLKATGRGISAPADHCVIELGGDIPVPLAPIEEPYRKSRYRLQSPVCPLVLEVLEHSVRVSIPDGDCSFVQADCRLAPEGLWGPTGEEAAGRATAIERQRGRAERDMRDISQKLLRRLSGDAQREAAAEQAAFSSERTTVCRNYAGEDQHGFCAAELTSGRVESLKRRYDQTPPRPSANR